jgi:hypothetical protein
VTAALPALAAPTETTNEGEDEGDTPPDLDSRIDSLLKPSNKP